MYVQLSRLVLMPKADFGEKVTNESLTVPLFYFLQNYKFLSNIKEEGNVRFLLEEINVAFYQKRRRNS